MSTWFDDWKTGAKAKVTLRHVLTHTSGLSHKKGAALLNQQTDRLAYARALPIVAEPGSKFSYSNEATQLLSGVVEAAAGEPLDVYTKKRLFTPLGIDDFRWDKDEAGNVQTFYGIALTARDLARIGSLMLDGGRWGDEQIVPQKWVQASGRADDAPPGHGLLWWIRRGRGRVLIPTAELPGLSVRVGNPGVLADLAGRKFTTHGALWMEVGSHLDAPARLRMADLIALGKAPFVEEAGPWLGFAADGWLGQQLIVFPKHGVIAVRQHRAPQDGSADGAYNKKYGFFDLYRKIESALPLDTP